MGRRPDALEQVKFDRTYGRRTREDYYWAPTNAWLGSGTNKIPLKTTEIFQEFVHERGSFLLDNNWQSNDVANCIAHTFDHDVKHFLESSGSTIVTIWTFADGSNVTIMGKMAASNGTPTLQADGDMLWISTETAEEMQKTIVILLAWACGLLFFGVVYLIAAFLDLAKSANPAKAGSATA